MFNRITTFLKEVQLEMKKVNWPTRQETIRYTLMVIGFTVVVAIFLGAFDFLFSNIRDCFFLKSDQCYIRTILGF